MLRIFNKYFLGIVVFYIFWLIVIPFVLSKSIGFACNQISQHSDYELMMDSPKIRLSVVPTVTFSVKKCVLKSKNNLEFEAEKTAIKLRLLPLLTGKIHVNTFTSSNIKVNGVIDNKMNLDTFYKQINGTKIIIDYFQVDAFDLQVRDRNIMTPIVYRAKDVVYKKANRYLRFSCNSTLSVANQKSDINIKLFLPKNNDANKTIFDVKVSNLHLSLFKTYFKYLLPDELVDLAGKIEVDCNKNGVNIIFNDCKMVMKDFAKSIILPKRLVVTSKLKAKYNCINLEEVVIKSDKIHIFLSGKIEDYLSKSLPKLSLDVNINKSRLEEIADLLPPFAVEEIDVYKLKKYKFYADIIGNLSIKGSLPEPDLYGNVLITNGILVKPIPRAKRGAVAKLSFIGKYANYDVQVAAGDNENVSVIGGVELYNVKFANMVVSTTENVDLKVTTDVLNPLHEILNFVIGPVPILDVYGKGNLNIKVKGNRQNSRIKGVMNFKNTDVNFKGLEGVKLKNANAILNFEDEILTFKTLNGTVNGKDFNIKGVCNMSGKFDFDVVSKGQQTNLMYDAIQKSTLIPEIKKMFPKIDNINGLMDLNLKIYGTLKYIENLKFNENAFVKGSITLYDNTVKLFDNIITNVSGKIDFDITSALIDLQAKIANAPMKIKAKIKNDMSDIVMDIPYINPNFYVNNSASLPQNILPAVSTKIKYKGKIEEIEYDKIDLYAKVLEPDKKGEVKVQSGEVYLQNGILRLSEIKGFIKQPQNNFYINLKLDKAFSDKPYADGIIKIKALDTKLITEMKSWVSIPQNIKQIINNYDFKNGVIDLDCRVVRNKYNADLNLDNFSFVYIPVDLPIQIINGKLSLKNNDLYIKKVNILADKMPMLVDGKVSDVFNKQKFDIYINTKPQQEFIDKYVNKKQIYPVKIKGDILLWAKLVGVKNNFDVETSVKLNKGASIYTYGASIGDIENDILLSSNIKVLPKLTKINYLSYDKLIESQNGKQTRLNMLHAFGSILQEKEVTFKDLCIKTSNPTDARIFNIIFRKPNIKEGQFTSNIKINGKMSSPKILGDFHIFETNIPFFDTTMKNIELVFKDKIVEISSKGDVVGNRISLKATMRNNFVKPYHIEKAEIYTQDLNFNNIVEKVKMAQMEEEPSISSTFVASPTDFILDDAKIYAENIELRNIHAKDVNAVAKIDANGVFDISKFDFKLANGYINGRYRYNMKNNDIKLKLGVQSISANDISIALFDLNNQIYGDMTGGMELACNGTNYKTCMQTLNGETAFSVKDGKMPKLGSLEYLLKAGNLVKSGITGMSINSVIDLITPLKTGNFSNIMGSIKIKNGIANNIEIITQGKDLSMYIAGTYNCATSFADMQVLGMLTRNISTMLGPIGNLSINTLFNLIPGVDLSKSGSVLQNINKIPGIELSNKSYRKFVAEIFGNINGDNYVSSFMWVN